MADPGFPRRGGANPKVGAPTYYLVKNFPKTAWKWKNLDPEGRVPGAPPPPLDLPMILPTFRWLAKKSPFWYNSPTGKTLDFQC